jgi:hypothetical protein
VVGDNNALRYQEPAHSPIPNSKARGVKGIRGVRALDWVGIAILTAATYAVATTPGFDPTGLMIPILALGIGICLMGDLGPIRRMELSAFPISLTEGTLTVPTTVVERLLFRRSGRIVLSNVREIVVVEHGVELGLHRRLAELEVHTVAGARYRSGPKISGDLEILCARISATRPSVQVRYQQAFGWRRFGKSEPDAR